MTDFKKIFSNWSWATAFPTRSGSAKRFQGRLQVDLTRGLAEAARRNNSYAAAKRDPAVNTAFIASTGRVGRAFVIGADSTYRI